MSHCPSCDLRALGGRQTVGTKGAREVGTNDIIGCILVDDEHVVGIGIQKIGSGQRSSYLWCSFKW